MSLVNVSMKVGLIDIEPKIFNTALMQISQYYKGRGDTVEWATPLTYKRYDVLYCSSLFDFTDKSEVPDGAICGGTGFHIESRLSQVMEAAQLDYSIYPRCKTSYLWFSRGCKRKCPWCVVPKKEGKFHLVNRKQLNPKGRYLTIMDNDFFANPDWADVIRWIGRMPVDIQSIDVRRLTKEKCEALDGLRQQKDKRFKIAWDNPKEDLEPKLKFMIQFVKPYKIMCYVLIGYRSDGEEDECRIQTLRALKIDPFVMPYNKNDPYQRAFTRWVNDKAIYKKCLQYKDYDKYVPYSKPLSGKII